jgi:CheY-like chemotaxis protein
MNEVHVLVIDGCAEDRRAGKAAFEALGCRVTTVATASDALTPVAVRHFDIVCVDPNDPRAEQVLTRLAPGQYAVAWRDDHARLSPRFDGVLARPPSPIVAAITVAMARMAAAMASHRASLSEQSVAA